ncbi:cell division protein FtsQ/DivIB [Vibrio sp. WXL103]|uniref:cell division protein FtsQ/DivIB n=1 Tax=unclassified Vibrio TaxID=2614977 RepID=UPI003EC8A037
MLLDTLQTEESHTNRSLVKKHAPGLTFLLVVLLLFSFLLHSVVSWMWDEHRLPLSKLLLQGEMNYVTAKDVQTALSNIDHIGTFMSQDVDVIQQSVQALPWVAQASIRKQWPDTIKVFLTEHSAEAIWNGQVLLNPQGELFDGDIGLLREDKVKLYGPMDTQVEVMETWRHLMQVFTRLDLEITSLVLNERRAWQIILDNGMRLELGKESLDERIARFVSLYHQLGEQAQRVSYIDLRYDTGAAIGWFPPQDIEQEITND